MATFWQQMATSMRLLNRIVFCCDKCDYKTSRKNDFYKHIQTQKHICRRWKHLATCDFFCATHNLTIKCIYDEEPSNLCCTDLQIVRAYEKKSQFMVSCDFSCDFSPDHNKSHKNRVNDKAKTEKFYVTCPECSKTYRDRSGLYKHKKKYHIKRSKHKNDVQNLTNMIETLICENKGLQTQLLELAKTPRVIQNNVIQKNKVNIVNFLNTDCKDAYNLSEFVTGLDITFDDIEFTKNNGYIEGMQYTLIKTLATMEETKRPIHCTDAKRRLFWIKDNNAWDRDKSNTKINNALNIYNSNQLKTVLEWKKNEIENENTDQDELQNDLNMIIKEFTGMYQNNGGDKIRNRIIDCMGNACLLPNDTKQNL